MEAELRQECIEVVRELIDYVEGEFYYPGLDKERPVMKLLERADRLLAELKR